MELQKNDDISHKIFEVGIFVKFIDGILEIIGGFLLLFINPDRLNRIVVFFTQHELLEDPKDPVANFIVNLSHTYSIKAEHFGFFYLLSHGLIKIVIYILLVKGSKKTYPFIIGTLLLFIIYQIYRFIYSGSLFMVAMTLLDIVILVLTIIEYKKKKDLK